MNIDGIGASGCRLLLAGMPGGDDIESCTKYKFCATLCFTEVGGAAEGLSPPAAPKFELLLLFAVSPAGLVERRIAGVEVACIQHILHHAGGFAEPLEVYDFTLPQIPDRVDHIRRNLMASRTSGSSASRRMLSYVARAFCSAAMSSVRSANASPLVWKYAAVNGTPAADAG